MPKKTNILIGAVIIILVIGGVMTFLNKAIPPTPQGGTEISPPGVKQEVSLTIDDGEGTLKTFKSKFKEGMTVFDLLEEKTRELGLTLKTKTYDIGVLVEVIGGKENGENGKYWLYYVNGEMPMVSADKKELRPGDKVEFKFEKSPF